MKLQEAIRLDLEKKNGYKIIRIWADRENLHEII